MPIPASLTGRLTSSPSICEDAAYSVNAEINIRWMIFCSEMIGMVFEMTNGGIHRVRGQHKLHAVGCLLPGMLPCLHALANHLSVPHRYQCPLSMSLSFSCNSSAPPCCRLCTVCMCNHSPSSFSFFPLHAINALYPCVVLLSSSLLIFLMLLSP